MGYGDDERLDDYYIDPSYGWPDGWDAPPSQPWEENHPIEHQAFENQTIPEDTYWMSDWGLPGKQHATKYYND